MVQLRLLGAIELKKEGEPLRDFRSKKALALLGYLARQAGPVNRSYLAHLFWPDYPEQRGRRNLSRELSHLSTLLPGCFESNYHAVRFTPCDRLWVDTAAFEELTSSIEFKLSGADVLAGGQLEARSLEFDEAIKKLAQAIKLYRGDFMAGHFLNDCPEFETWLIREQELWQQRARDVLEELFAHHAQHQQYEQAQPYIKQWLALEPWAENAHCYMMFLLARSGRRGAALAQYEMCRQALAEELGVTPGPETTALYEQIKSGALSPNVKKEVDKSAPLPHSPYRGLSTFSEADAPYFFGRETVVAHLLEAVHHQPLVAVIGPSGSGKSSLVFAGLLPHLRQGALPFVARDSAKAENYWRTGVFRPGSHPIRALAGALTPLFTPHLSQTRQLVEAAKLTEALYRQHFTLAEAAACILETAPKAERLLLVIDQFEELYTLCPDADIRQRFLELLFSPAEKTEAREQTAANPAAFSLVLTLRADFLGQALAYRPLADVLPGDDIMLGPMTLAEMSRIIVEPAKKQNVTFEPGLVERILTDVGDEPGNLPLLEFALTALWEEQAKSGGELSLAAYDSIGRVHGALTRYADQIYDQLNQSEQDRMRWVLLQMIQPGEGTGDTRRLATRTELGESGWQMAQHLANARLVVTGRDAAGQETAEIAHEALIKGWSRLHQWLNENRAFRVWQERLRVALNQWKSIGQDEGALLRGGLLAEAEAWLAERSSELSQQETEFIEASIALHKQRLQAAEAQHQRELEQAQALAESERRQAESERRAGHRLRWLAAGLVIILLIAVGAALWAWQEQQNAQQSARIAQSLNLATSAQLALSQNNTDLALRLALEANRLDEPPPQAQLMLAEAAYAPGTRRLFTGHSGPVQGVAFSPDGQTALSASVDQTLILWNINTGDVIRRFTGHTDAVNAVAFSPDGTTALSASADQTLILWEVTSGDIIRRFTGHTDAVNAVAFSPDGTTALSASADQTLILWDVTSGDIIRRFSGHSEAVVSLAVSPDGRMALSGAVNGDVILWDLPGGEIIYRLAGHDVTIESVQAEQGHAGVVWAVAFSPDGRAAYSASEEQTVVRWNLNEPDLSFHRFHVEPGSGVFSLAITPDGQSLLTGLMDSRITLINPATDEPQLHLLGHTGRVLALAVSPDGRTALSGAADGTLRLWNLRHGALLRHLRDEENVVTGTYVNLTVTSLDLSPDGRLGVTGHWTGQISLWDYDTGNVRQTLTGHTEMVFAGTLFSPDGQRVVSGSGDIFAQAKDNTVRVWDVATGQELT